MHDRSTQAYRDASRCFVDVVAQIEDWDRRSLGDWTVRELVAHANRALTTVVDYVEQPQAPAPPGSGYFTDAAIAARGRESVVALGDDPARAVAVAAGAAADLVEQSPPETTVGSPLATLTLAQYLPSRTAELVVHTLDLARAMDRELTVPAPALEEALLFVARRAAGKAGQQVLLALTGRSELPTGYSVY